MAEHAMYFTSPEEQRKFKAKSIAKKVVVYLFLTIFALFILAPFVVMVMGSFIEKEAFSTFSTEADFSKLGFGNWTFDNYATIFASKYYNVTRGVWEDKPSFAVYFLNTLIVALGSTIVTVVTAVLAAFAFARLEFKGKDLLFTALLTTMMIPGEMMVITNFKTTLMLNWQNTFSALIFVHGVSVFYIFYLRQTFQQIPNELYLAAKVDGVGDIGYLLKVMIPIAMPTVMTIVILSLMGGWNSYVWPALVANGNWKYDKTHTMALVSNGLMSVFSTAGSGYDAIKLAGSMVVSAPLFVFFLCFRKYIMRGVSRSGIKG